MAFHPLAVVVARQRVRQGLRDKGVGFVQSLDAARNVTADDLDETAAAVGVAVPADVADGVGAIGDGKILDAIIAFFKSPEGQALIAALVKMLLALIGA